MTITSLEPLELPMPEPEDDPADPYPEYGSRDEFERAQWFGDRARSRSTTRLSKTSTPSATTAKSLSKETQ
jgi:hypothetical protein